MKIKLWWLVLALAVVLFIAGCIPPEGGEEAPALAGEAALSSLYTGCSSYTNCEDDGSVFVQGSTRTQKVKAVVNKKTKNCVETEGSWTTPKQDKCGTGKNKDKLKEYYCSTNGEIKEKKVTCPHGCADGACLPTVCTVNEIIDDTSVYSVTGIMLSDPVFRGFPPSQWEAKQYTDTCADSSTVRYYNCGDDGSSIFVTSLDDPCEPGWQCENSYCGLPLGSPCEPYTGECGSGICGWDGSTFVCEKLNQPTGSPCKYSDECASKLSCRGHVSESTCRVPTAESQPTDFLCDSDVECLSGLCGWDGSTLVCEEPNQLGSPCQSERECASGLCGTDGSTRVCEEPNPLGSYCRYHEQCASGLVCGINEQNLPVCEELNQPAGSTCGTEVECASFICGVDDQSSYVCKVPVPLGSYCRYNQQCASGLCEGGDSGNSVCKEPKALDSPCTYEGECASGLVCGFNDQSLLVCEVPNQPAGSPCVVKEECASNSCDNNNRCT